MSKILVIEPDRVLRQAITLSLFPDHEVDLPGKTQESNIESLEGYDLVVVDGAALRESSQLSVELSRVIQNSTTPTIWLEEEGGSCPVKRESLVVVKKPVERKLFQTAINKFLSPTQGGRGDRGATQSPAHRAENTPEKAIKKGRAEDPQQPTLQFIELVDVVEDAPADKQQRKTPRKSQ